MADSMPHQQTLPIFDYSDVVDHFANGDSETRGAVFTRREVVTFVLDLSDYTTDRPLHRCRLLEPAFGDGDFLLPAVERLLTMHAAQVPGRADVIQAVETTSTPTWRDRPGRGTTAAMRVRCGCGRMPPFADKPRPFSELWNTRPTCA